MKIPTSPWLPRARVLRKNYTAINQSDQVLLQKAIDVGEEVYTIKSSDL